MIRWLCGALALAACAPSIEPDAPPDAAPVDPVNGADAAPPPGKVEVVENPDGSSTVTVNATAPEEWVYVDLAGPALMEPADPATSADWDLAFQRFHYALDGGVSGAGQGALVPLDGVALTDVNEAPADGWVTDEPDDEKDEDALPEYAFETAAGGWYDYDDVSHVLTPKQGRVYIVRGGGGALFVLRIDAYYNEAGSAAWPEFTVKPLTASAP